MGPGPPGQKRRSARFPRFGCRAYGVRMSRMSLLAIWVLGTLAGAPLACAEPGDAPPLRAEPARPRAANDARVEVRAPIVRVSVRLGEPSVPRQYFADITSALPDGCARFARADLRRAGDVLLIDVFNTRPVSDDTACPMIYGEQETAVALGSELESGKTYTLDVNGTRETFVVEWWLAPD
jgi:hypothetical protein